ncbi:YceI family protein, partial [Aquiflexum sp.]|uniref:YceI family protein n=1 Tax=Aquiflexum sp. TaxID=1872584 RepID=UPI003593E429
MKTNRLDIFTSFIFLMILFFMGGFNFPNEGESQRKEEYVKFRIKNMGFNVDGEFSNFTKSVSYNKQNPEFSMFKGTISGASINTGIKKRDEHLRGEEYFHIEKFGQIAFESTSVKKTGVNEMKVTG